MGLIGKIKDTAKKVGDTVKSSPIINEISNVASQSGAAIAEQANNCDNFKDQIKDNNNKIDRYQSQINELNATIARNKVKSNQQQNQIDQDEATRANLNNKIADLRTKIGSAKAKIAQLTEQMAAAEIVCNATIHDLNSRLEESDISNNVQILLNVQKDAIIADEYLLSHYPRTPNDITKEKIEYREVEHQKLVTLSKTLDVLFYCIFIAFFIIIIITGNFKFKEHFLLYLFIILLPFIFPYFYKMCKYFYSLTNNFSYGPKNAFIDNSNDPFLTAYNV